MIKRRPTSSPRLQGTKHETDPAVLERARYECDFSDRLYDILIEFQTRGAITRKIKSVSDAPIGDLNMRHTALYNAIWDAALNVSSGGRRNKTSTRTNKPKGESYVETIETIETTELLR